MLHLEDLIVDVSNMLAYHRFMPYAALQFKLVKTDDNDRSRSRISSRKPLDTTAELPAATTFFAKEWAEFGNAWREMTG